MHGQISVYTPIYIYIDTVMTGYYDYDFMCSIIRIGPTYTFMQFMYYVVITYIGLIS